MVEGLNPPTAHAKSSSHFNSISQQASKNKINIAYFPLPVLPLSPDATYIFKDKTQTFFNPGRLFLEAVFNFHFRKYGTEVLGGNDLLGGGKETDETPVIFH